MRDEVGRRDTHTLYDGTGAPADSSENPVICFKVAGEGLAD